MTAELINSARFPLDLASLNEALMQGLVRQHELREAAELLSERLGMEIEARKKAEEALIRSEKLASVGRMASVLAHEINNPLEAVTNILFLVQTTEGMPGSVLDYLHMADAELRRITHVTRQTLGFYREAAAPSTVPIAALLESVVEILQAKVESKHATVLVECNPALQLTAYPGELRQVISNLLMNSLESLPALEGRVTMRAVLTEPACRMGHCLRISIADNGCGIRGVDLRELFQPFYTTKGTVGNGLGLWVSRQIVEKHGGNIRIRSCAGGPRQGTTVAVILPTSPAGDGPHAVLRDR